MSGSSAAPADIQTRSTQGVLESLLLALRDIKLAHSVFALPFALLGAFLATPVLRGGDDASWATLAWQLGLIVVCMVLARTWAMLFNRLVDARFDRENPRTAGRAFASGRVSLARGWIIASISAACFVVACAGFYLIDKNVWPIALSLPTLGWVALYSLTKRFTSLSHLFLGGALAASPIAAALAIDPAFLWSHAVVWWLALMVVFWVGGFDVLYALQDEQFDRERGLRSIPSRFGASGGVWLSRLMHLVCWGALVMSWRTDDRLGVVFALSVVLVGVLLLCEHAVLQRRGLAGLPVVFFLINGIVSCVVGTLGIMDLFVQ
ncbi:MAG: 4-hydroxybenzoate octaprenyltransferase [Phycisphaerales bacterium JB043]